MQIAFIFNITLNTIIKHIINFFFSGRLDFTAPVWTNNKYGELFYYLMKSVFFFIMLNKKIKFLICMFVFLTEVTYYNLYEFLYSYGIK